MKGTMLWAIASAKFHTCDL